jgi:hypothetical protein
VSIAGEHNIKASGLVVQMSRLSDFSKGMEAFRILDWASPELAEVQTLFLRAARVVGSRTFELPKALRHRIAAKLEHAGVSRQRTGKLKEFTPLGGPEDVPPYLMRRRFVPIKHNVINCTLGPTAAITALSTAGAPPVADDESTRQVCRRMASITSMATP